MIKKIFLLSILTTYSVLATAAFEVIALGVDGGVSDGNLSSYLIRDTHKEKYLALDAGSVLPGIDIAIAKSNFPNITTQISYPYTIKGYIFRNLIDSYFITHGHLDHIAGLIIASPEDTKKNIYTNEDTAQILSRYYFNWQAWPNFTQIGTKPYLNLYQLKPIQTAQKFPIGNTSLTGTIYPLNHSGSVSSMILISSNDEYFAYFGDTGPDVLENSSNLDTIWRKIAPLFIQKKLKGIIIEVSFPNEVADKNLFGHLTPNWLIKELDNLSQYSGKQVLKDFPVIISHIKPQIKQQKNIREIIKQQLNENNHLGIHFIIMEQGERAVF